MRERIKEVHWQHNNKNEFRHSSLISWQNDKNKTEIGPSERKNNLKIVPFKAHWRNTIQFSQFSLFYTAPKTAIVNSTKKAKTRQYLHRKEIEGKPLEWTFEWNVCQIPSFLTNQFSMTHIIQDQLSFRVCPRDQNMFCWCW